VVLESANDQEHADGNVECRGTDASGETVGDGIPSGCNGIRLNGSRMV
jgi:hypothetical protein